MSVDEEINYPRMPVYTAKEYDELKVENERLKRKFRLSIKVMDAEAYERLQAELEKDAIEKWKAQKGGE